MINIEFLKIYSVRILIRFLQKVLITDSEA